MSLRSCALPLLLVAAVHAPLAAEETPAPSPEQRMAAVLASLPKPDSGARLEFEGEMLDQGAVVGTLRLSVEAAAAGSAGVWQALDEMRVGPKGEDLHVRCEALLDERLMGLEGRTVARMRGESDVTLTWKRSPEGYDFTRQEGEAEATSMPLVSAAARVPTLAALVFLAQHLPAEGAAHALGILLVDVNLGADAAVRARTQVLMPLGVGPVEVGGVPTKLPRVALTRQGEPEHDSTLALAQDRKGLLQVNGPGGETMLRLPPKAGPFDFAAPATTAQGAALKAARAFAVADLKALEAVLNWPSIDAKLASNPAFSSLEPAARRAKLLEELGAELTAIPAETIEMVLRGMTDALEIEDLGKDRARVTFPPLFRGMKLVVKKVGAVWLLDELPGNG